ncbi:hypothetical protein MSG28_001063 [Choristoneura fumiferana]|uniref:Uncharacterized protein n=1 Tax=Choristoneura fumiferana TaxID=7141 RepID=A0ACC0K3E3_CHOFU|nr:hypothetical protein MSG28_001063 [Choristoneura fumiferana]
MTTASVLLTVSNNWNSSTEKCEKEVLGRAARSVAAVAARELRETPATREQALRIMRDWLQKNPDVANVRQDESFLLRFLRQKKYSIPMAQQTLLKYLNLRKYYRDCFTNLDCEDPQIKGIISDGYIMISPVRDSKGRRVIIYNISKFDPGKYIWRDMCRAHVIVYESIAEDPVDQVCGVTHVGSGIGASGAHVMLWNPVDFARIIKWGEQSLPMRHKEIHVVDMPAGIRYVVDFAISMTTPKMAERVKLHTNQKSMHSHVDPACLPDTYGGSIPTRDMIQHTKQILSEQRKKLLSLDEMEILSTRGIVSSRGKTKLNTQDVEGSFRKLDID